MPLPIGKIGPVNLPAASSRLHKPVADQGTERREALEKACRDFESLFVNYMLKQMRETVPQNGLFGGGQAERMYTSMMDEEVAKEISKQRGLGLAPMMYRQMISVLGDDTRKE
jgi:flagellar protein FlgJ